MVCPSSRAIAITPLRSGGALDISACRLGDWKKPKPAPQTAMRTAMSATEGSAGSQASEARPALRTTRPPPPSAPEG